MSIEEVIDFLKSKKKLYSQMDESGRKDYVMECLDTAINLLSNMTDGDLISRVKDIIRNDTYLSEAQVIDLLRRIDDIPTTEENPTVYGEWKFANKEEVGELEKFNYKVCSICGYGYPIQLFLDAKFCPNCGAKMKGEE